MHLNNSLKNTVQFCIASALCVAIPSHATNSNLLNHATGLTTGQSSNQLSLFSGIYNPAMGNVMIDDDEHFRMNYFFSFTDSTEYGQVDNFIDDLDELIDILDDPSLNTDPVNVTLDKFNVIIESAGKEGYLKTSNGFYIPFSPLFWKPDFLPGTLAFEANIETQIKVSVLADRLIYDSAKETFTTATSAYLKSGLQKKFSVGYSQEYAPQKIANWGGTLIFGARINIYNMELSKQVYQLQLLEGENIEDVIENQYKKHRVRSTNMGIDLGLVWLAPSYRLGASIVNLNAPSFNYGEIGTQCDSHIEGSNQQSNCYISDYFINTRGMIKGHEKHKKNPVITLDGSYFLLDNWLISGAAELASYDDAIGTENQWLSASTSYHPTTTWLPDWRFGYSKNLVGSKLSYANLGLTLFNTFNLDLSMALEDAVIEEEKHPRGLSFAISFEEHF
ncbi:MAG: conjugal transfer protein TraF [Marinagarivorans sp.]|nr:conjugal transfer protein TraF [Marinagarivorans sp.]